MKELRYHVVPEETMPHDADDTCWCLPEIETRTVDAETVARVTVHHPFGTLSPLPTVAPESGGDEEGE